MASLTKQEAAQHAKACELLEKDVLTFDDKLFVVDWWQESANHVNSAAGAFFTPHGLARDLATEVGGRKIVDLCGGIGKLAFAYFHSFIFSSQVLPNITIVEINPDYVRVGKKLLPEAKWICADVLNLPSDIGHFNTAIANPPFGRIHCADTKAPRYTGAEFEFKVLDIASGIADYGVFIIPQSSSPFAYSGRRNFEEVENRKYQRFSEQTKIQLSANSGFDTSVYDGDWHGVSVRTEIVLADFREARERREPVLEPEIAEEPAFTPMVLAAKSPAPVQQSLFAL